jgi:hypothetical protein
LAFLLAFWPDFFSSYKNNTMPDPKNDQQNSRTEEERREVDPQKKHQQQTDPQITELKGFVDPQEDLEPTLEDGTKAPEKGPR